MIVYASFLIVARSQSCRAAILIFHSWFIKRDEVVAQLSWSMPLSRSVPDYGAIASAFYSYPGDALSHSVTLMGRETHPTHPDDVHHTTIGDVRYLGPRSNVLLAGFPWSRIG